MMNTVHYSPLIYRRYLVDDDNSNDDKVDDEIDDSNDIVTNQKKQMRISLLIQ